MIYIKKVITMMALLTLSCFTAFADPGEHPYERLTRQSGQQQLSTDLSKNIYRTEAYQAPYWETEYYTVIETRCSYECHTEQRCGYENQCHTSPGHRECREECGTNALGELVCKQVCYDVPGQTTCRDEYVCRNENVCGNVCREVPVQYSRQVEKCCRTEYRQVFDHQISQSVSVKFPAGSELYGSEKEIFSVQLSDTDRVTFNLVDTILGYRIASQTNSGNHTAIDLVMIPKYTAEEMGKKSIKSVILDLKNDGSAAIKFQDDGLAPRIKTGYSAEVREKSTGAVVARTQAAGEGKLAVLPLDEKLSLTTDYVIVMRVLREGIVLDQKVDFTIEAQALAGPQDERPYVDPKSIKGFFMQGKGAKATLHFTDKAPIHVAVRTAYEVEIERSAGFLGTKRERLVLKVLPQENLKLDAEGKVVLSVNKDLGVDAATLNKYINTGYTIYIRLKVTRDNQRINNGKTVVIEQAGKYNVPDAD